MASRFTFIKQTLWGVAGMAGLKELEKLAALLPVQGAKPMPVLFVGHGSPMNAIEDNEFSQRWQQLGKQLPIPAAILCVSAHWLTQGTYVTAMQQPETIHDFGGFPQELFNVQYPAPGSPATAQAVKELVQLTNVGLNHDWGLDHGTWSIARKMFPEANIPIVQLSIDYHRPAQYHYNLAAQLSALRSKGVLIIGSGNMVHNLRMVAFDKINQPGYGFDWALEMNTLFKKHIQQHNHAVLINYEQMGPAAKLAIPTPDHYYPMIYTLGLLDKGEEVEFFNDKTVGGSLTMTSFRTV